MPAIDFPASPALNDEYSFEGRTWRWNGTGWEVKEYPAALLAGTAANPSLYFSGDANTGLYSPGADQVAISTGGTERARIDSSGRLLVGTSTSTNFIGTVQPAFLQLKEDAGNFALGLQRASNDTAPPNIAFRKTRSTTDGGVTAVADGDALGQLRFIGTDGTGAIQAALIRCEVDGTPGTNDMPGRLVFSTTADGASSPTERLRITSAGRVGIGTSAPATAKLVVADTTNQLSVTTGTQELIVRVNSTEAALYSFQAIPLAFYTNNSERARIDSSGRLLVGTSSTSADTRLILQGNSNNVNAGAYLHLQRGTLPAGDGTPTGRLVFADNSSNAGAQLESYSEGAWTSGSSHPGRLVFLTTADGAATPTERLRITSAGVLQVADAGNISVGTTTGTKIGTATTQKLGFYNKTPVVQPAAVADATDAASVITQLNALLARMRDIGLIAT